MTTAAAPRGRSERSESKALIRHAFELARSLGIGKLLVRADVVEDITVVHGLRKDEKLVWVTSSHDVARLRIPGDRVIVAPDLRLSRISQIKIGLFVAVVRRYVDIEESIICLSGTAGSQRIDTLLIANPRRDIPWLRREDVDGKRTAVPSNVLETVIQVALRISEGGYEGRPAGTIFVIGETKDLRPYLRQLILNPLQGHPAKQRSVYSPDFVDTLRELAALDGAFIVNTRGTVESAGTYLDAPTRNVRLRSGLGARHAAAAAITVDTGAMAVAVSETSGSVSVFRKGELVLELERPEPRARRALG